MDLAGFQDYMASLYKREATDPVVIGACNMAIGAFTSARPWTFCRKDVTLTTDANGIITFPEDYEAVISIRERVSSGGGWVQIWSDEKFDWTLPRLDNLTGSYPKACKIYLEDGTWYGQTAPPVASAVVYVTYKTKISDITAVPDKYLPGVIACANFFMTVPSNPEHPSAAFIMDNMIKRLWKEDRKAWTSAFRVFDVDDVRRNMRWWDVWDW